MVSPILATIITANEPCFMHPVSTMSQAQRLALLTALAGDACLYPSDGDGHPRLLPVVSLAMQWAAALAPSRDVDEDVFAELERAIEKHDGFTPLSPLMTDEQRVPVLLEEVGEVARACTPDASTPVGHGGDLRGELLQVAAMAAAWHQAIVNAGVSRDR